MPHTQTIQDFNRSHHTTIDVNSMVSAVSSILTTYNEAQMRDERLKKYFLDSYPEVAAQYQRNSLLAQYDGQDMNDFTANPGSMLNEYLALFYVVVNSVSEMRIRDAQQAAIDAKEATRKAEEAMEAARAAYNDSLNGDRSNSRALKDDYDKAEQKAKAAKKNEENAFTFTRYTPSMPHFGLGSKDAEKLMNDQLSSFNFLDIRRQQIATRGVTHPSFLEEVTDMSETLYTIASVQEQQKLREIWVTRELMHEELESRSWFSKYIWNRAEAKAMRNYIDSSTRLLQTALFNTNEQVENDIKKMLAGGFYDFGEEAEAAMSDIKKLCSINDKALEEKQAKKDAKKVADNLKVKQEEKELADQRAKQEKKNEIKAVTDSLREKYKADREALKGKSINDRIFDIRFKPSFDKKTFGQQVTVMEHITKNYLNKKDIPESARNVFMKNVEKINLMKEYHELGEELSAQSFIDKANSVSQAIDEIDNAARAELQDYVPYSYEQLKKAPDKVEKEHLTVNLESNWEQKDEVAPKHEAPDLSKEPMVKDQIQ